MTSRAWLLVLVLAAIGAAVFVMLPRWEGNPPEIVGLTDVTLGRVPGELELSIEDPEAGLRSVELRVMSAAGSKTLVTRVFPGSLYAGGEVHRERIALALDTEALSLPDGQATLTIVVRDWSLRNGFDGNRGEESATLVVDTEPPKVTALSGLTYVKRGGSAAVVYRVAPDATRHGVRVADTFFQGHEFTKAAGDLRVAIFGVPVDAPADPAVRVVAADAAGTSAPRPSRSVSSSRSSRRVGFHSRRASSSSASARSPKPTDSTAGTSCRRSAT